MSASEVASSKIVVHVVEVLKTAAKPLTFGQLKKDTGLNDAELRSALDQAASESAVFRWPDYRRSQYFWSRSPESAAQEAALAVASELALPRAKLVFEARKRVPGFSQQALARIVANLLSERQLQQVPAFTTGKLLIRSGGAAAYAASARAFVERKFQKAGFDPALLLAFPPKQSKPVAAGAFSNVAELILQALRTLEPVTGVPVSAQRLRNQLPGLSKKDFDAAALELRKRQQVFLSLDHDPHNLSPQEREILIDGRDGTYYVAIAIR